MRMSSKKPGREAVIVTTASREGGMGHVVRMVTLARMLDKFGCRVRFLVNAFEPAVDWIERNGYPCDLLPKGKMTMTETADLVIVDIFGLKNSDLAGVRPWAGKIIVFEAEKKEDIKADAVITAILEGLENREGEIGGTRYHWGPKYMIFDPAFEGFHEASKQIEPEVKTAVVCCGGTDFNEYSLLAARQAKQAIPHLELTVVVSSAYREALIGELTAMDGVRVLKNVSNMAELFFTADMAMVSGGLSLFEVAAVGTPCIVLPQNDHQETTAKRFVARRAAWLWESSTDNQARIRSLCRDWQARKEMSKNAKGIFPGINSGVADVFKNLLAA